MSAPATTEWWAAGEAFFADALADANDLDAPSSLPGWDRRTLVAHVARNADALVNLLTWARTGVETPMYSSPEARDASIATSAAQHPHDLAADCRTAAARLEVAVQMLPASCWQHEVRTAQGRTVAASEVLWMRCREVWVHAVDLGSGATFAQVPDDVLDALISDVTAMWDRRDESPAVRFVGPDRSWGTGATTVTGSTTALAAYVTGRSTDGIRALDGDVPVLPRWL